MKEIENGIVFSDDIKMILQGSNALNYQYEKTPRIETIETVRKDFKNQVNSIFDKVTILKEEEMLELNNLIEGRYPHRIIG